MPRTKKTLDEQIEEVLASEPTKELIALLELDLGREDLNKLVAKLNEVIKKVNQ